jgi:hypothetical protein
MDKDVVKFIFETNLYGEKVFELSSKYWMKYKNRIDKEFGEINYTGSIISLEDEGFSLYHDFSFVGDQKYFSAYINMKTNTITSLDKIELVPSKRGDNIIVK